MRAGRSNRREFLAQAAAGLTLASSGGRVFAQGGSTYFVNSATGDDSNSGRSESRPWRTLEKINSTEFSAGDRILLAAETRYAGQLKLKSSGQRIEGRPAPITVDRYGEGKNPLLDAQGRYQSTVYLHNVEYVTVSNLEILNKGTDRAPRRYGVFVHLKDFGTASHLQLRNLYVHDVNGSLVKSKGGSAGIQWLNEGGSKKSRFDGFLVDGCRVQRCGRNGIMGRGYTDRREWYPSLNVVIRNNLLEEIPGDGIVPIGCDGAVIEYNLMRDCTRLLPDTEAAAGIWPWACDNTVIQFNEVSDHKAPWDAQGFDSDWNCRNTVIQYNLSRNNEGGFLLICNNGGASPHIAINTGTVIRYNVSLNDGIRPDVPPRYRQEKRWFSPTFHISGPVKNTRIHNNLIYVPHKSDSRMDRTLVQMDNWGGPWPEGTYFANNIFVVEGLTRYSWGGSQDHRFMNNLYRGVHEQGPQDPGALRADPRFVAEEVARAGLDGCRGFICRRSSPCIGAALPIETPGIHDYFGYPIDAGGPHNVGVSERAL
jgi:hypothetical protein